MRHVCGGVGRAFGPIGRPTALRMAVGSCRHHGDGVDAPPQGSPDPDVVVQPYVTGRQVRLTFTGHENPSTGGFGELLVVAVR